MPVIQSLLDNAAAYAKTFDKGGLPMHPSKKIAVVACMDARLDVYGLLGLDIGEAHVLTNAGGAITEDVIRSLAVSQYRLGTEEIIVIYHTNCGMRTFTDEEFKDEMEAETGTRPDWAKEVFVTPEEDVRESLRRLAADPFLKHRENIRGFVYDVHKGTLTEVTENSQVA